MNAGGLWLLQLCWLGAALLGLCQAAMAQESPPKAGRYSCFSVSYVVMPGGTNSGNPSTGGDAFRNNPLQSIPAAFGEIVVDAKGGYTFSNAKGGGRVAFDTRQSTLSFTGDLSVMRVSRYNSKTDSFLISKDSLSFECALAASSAGPTANPSAPVVAQLNEGLEGRLLVTAAYRYNSYLGKAFEFNLASGQAGLLFSDGIISANPKGDILHVDKTSRMKITDRTGQTTIKQLTHAVNYNFDDLYAAISNTGDHFAYSTANRSKTGTLADMVSKGTKLVIADRNATAVAEFVGYTHAAWMPQGGLVAVGDGILQRGVFMIDPKFRSVQRLFSGYDDAQMPAVSPNGNQVAFSSKGEIWMVDLDGRNPKKVIVGNESLFPTWSPDGKRLAVNVLIKNTITRSLIYVLTLSTDKGFYVVDSAGNHVESRNRISWLP